MPQVVEFTVTKCNTEESWIFNLIIRFRVCFQPVTIFVIQDAILLCYSRHKFQGNHFIYSTNFNSILIASQLLYQEYKIVYLSPLIYLTIFWLECAVDKVAQVGFFSGFHFQCHSTNKKQNYVHILFLCRWQCITLAIDNEIK
jgi:hypothetical protein